MGLGQMMWQLVILTSGAAAFAACSDGPSRATTPSCTFRVTLENGTFGPAGGTGTATVNSAPGCAWAAATAATDWISVSSGATGTGDGQVRFTVAAYDGSTDRTGSIVVAKQTLTIAQQPCVVQLSPAEQSIPDSGAIRDITVQAQPGCRWSLEGAPVWMTLTPSAGAGDATVKIQISENNTATTRVGIVRAGGATMSITQGRERCDYALDVQPAQFTAAGGTGTVALKTAEGCAWLLAADADWIRVSSSTGTGPAQVAFDVGASAQPAERRTTLRANGALAAVVQDALCSFSVSPVRQYAHSYGESGSIAVRATPGCRWTASAPAPWIHIDKGDGSGSSEIHFTIDQYSELAQDPRKAPIEVRWNAPTLGENAWIWQFSNCHIWFDLADPNTTVGVHMPAQNVVEFPADGGTAHVIVRIQSFMRCQYIAESRPAAPFVLSDNPLDPLFDVIHESERDLRILAPPNTTGQQRTTSMIVGEATLTIRQPPK